MGYNVLMSNIHSWVIFIVFSWTLSIHDFDKNIRKSFFHEAALFRGNIVNEIFSLQLCVLQRPYNILIRLRSGILIVIIYSSNANAISYNVLLNSLTNKIKAHSCNNQQAKVFK